MGAGFLELLLDRRRDQPAPGTDHARCFPRHLAGGPGQQGNSADGGIHHRLYADSAGAPRARSVPLIGDASVNTGAVPHQGIASVYRVAVDQAAMRDG
uniref:Uncharacterized protein n=1 Tax=Ralstonia solanacearum TaxID=305 RepID=A0A0S4TQD0_RALSL|nr:protein of unknown function [Ralstonia solanacearum]